MSQPRIILYGATGYSLGLAITELRKAGLPFTLGGRTESKLSALAASLSVPYHVFSPTSSPAATIDAALAGHTVLINGAGPFKHTAAPLMDACIRNGVHYVDITAELGSLDAAAGRDEAARKAGVMLLPTGGSGVESILDCFGGRMLGKVQGPVKLEQTLNIHGPLSRGTVATIRGFDGRVVRRVDGELVPHSKEMPADIDFRDGRGGLPRFPTSDPQIVTLGRATGVSNISTFCAMTGGKIPEGDLEDIPEGPSEAEREKAPYHMAFEVTGADGKVKRAVLHLVNGYTLTGLGVMEASKAVLAGKVQAGFQTPFAVFGGDYVNTFPGVEVEEY
jgi:short subunit dehydrogenase-like uncharacterized protein